MAGETLVASSGVNLYNLACIASIAARTSGSRSLAEVSGESAIRWLHQACDLKFLLDPEKRTCSTETPTSNISGHAPSSSSCGSMPPSPPPHSEPQADGDGPAGRIPWTSGTRSITAT